MGVFVIGYMAIVSYATMNIGRKLTLLLAFTSLVEWLVVGATIGAVYKAIGTPAATRRVGV